MPTDFGSLLRRDHHDLVCGLDELLKPWASRAQLGSTLDGIRLGLTAHAEAEDIVLYHALMACPDPGELEPLLAQAREAHLAQETALSALVCALPGTDRWRDRALQLRALVHDHAVIEEEQLVPMLRRVAPPEVYARLAGRFATERLRQLAMLQPSAPIYVSELQAS